ncbi:glucose-1-phosphate thymidylyltransferase [Candidatus Uhrbacteria bacterium]|nr:glucose-1-phosphate thymidylyltransferase [Candidatus Uhrbacteria bacterium]
MKALIAAGGHATRLRPITWTINKHLIPLANKPMIGHVIEKIVEAGITDIIINVNEGEVGSMKEVLGDGGRFGATLTFVEQRGGAKGVAHVVANAEELLRGSRFLFFLGDNIILGSIKRFVQRFEKEKLDCLLAFARVKDPKRFGVPEFDEKGNLVRFLEKPANPPSDFAVTGIYLYSDRYFDAFKTVTPSSRGEYEISDVNTWFIKNSTVGYEEITGWWKDTGTPEALLEGNALILDDTERSEFVAESTTDACVQGLVKIGKGTTISADCLIRGPVVIGDGCRIENAYIGPYSSIGSGVSVEGTEIEHSIIFEGATLRGAGRIVDSLVGKQATIMDHQLTHPRSGRRIVVGDNSSVEL